MLLLQKNHPFYAIRKYHRPDGTRYFSNPEWVTVKDLTKNHMIGYRLDIPTLPDSFITDAEAWALGRWLADGSVDTNRSTPRIFISVGESKIDATKAELQKLPFDIYENRVHKTAVNFVFTFNEFYNLIIDAGRGAANKRVPAFVFKLPYRLQKIVLDGYVSGDGYIRNRGNNTELSASTVSRELAYEIAKLIRNCYHSSVNISISAAKDGIIDGRIIKSNHDVYNITSSITTSV